MAPGQANQPQPGGRSNAALLQALRRQRSAARLEHLVHDLRNPLSVIQGYGQLLRASSSSEGDQHDLQALLHEVERLGARLDDLDAFLAPAPAEPQLVDLDRLARVVLSARPGLAVPSVAWTAPAPTALGHLATYAQALLAAWERLPTARQPQVLGLVGAPSGRLVLALAEGQLPGSGAREWTGGVPPTEELRLCCDQLAVYGARLVVDDRVAVLDVPAA